MSVPLGVSIESDSRLSLGIEIVPHVRIKSVGGFHWLDDYPWLQAFGLTLGCGL